MYSPFNPSQAAPSVDFSDRLLASVSTHLMLAIVALEARNGSVRLLASMVRGKKMPVKMMPRSTKQVLLTNLSIEKESGVSPQSLQPFHLPVKFLHQGAELQGVERAASKGPSQQTHRAQHWQQEGEGQASQSKKGIRYCDLFNLRTFRCSASLEHSLEIKLETDRT